ncbi:MAG: hypothetical protein ACJ8H8_12060 [Geminicoccaceae bacterium]
MVARACSARSPIVAVAAAPTLGVTTTLGGLWIVASGLGLAHGQLCPLAAAALDPSSAGSIVDCWAMGLLALATLLALSWPGSRLLAITPALLLLGDAGELHLRWARSLIGQSGASNALPMAKLVASLALGALALAPLLLPRHRNCTVGFGHLQRLALQLCCGGAAAIVLDLCEHGAGPQVRPMLLSCEEWLEVFSYALLARGYLAHTARSSHYGPNMREPCRRLVSGIAESLKKRPLAK